MTPKCDYQRTTHSRVGLVLHTQFTERTYDVRVEETLLGVGRELVKRAVVLASAAIPRDVFSVWRLHVFWAWRIALVQ